MYFTSFLYNFLNKVIEWNLSSSLAIIAISFFQIWLDREVRYSFQSFSKFTLLFGFPYKVLYCTVQSFVEPAHRIQNHSVGTIVFNYQQSQHVVMILLSMVASTIWNGIIELTLELWQILKVSFVIHFL